MKKKLTILLAVALLCVLAVVGTLARGTLAVFFTGETAAEETATGFYEPLTYTPEELEGTTAPGWLPPHYAIHGVELQVEQYLQDTNELLVTIRNTSDRELIWSGNQVTDFQLLYWDGAIWDFVHVEEGYEPHPHPYNTGELARGQEVTVNYALEHFPLLREGTRYRIAIWIREAAPPEDGSVGSYQIHTEFELPLQRTLTTGYATTTGPSAGSITLTAQAQSYPVGTDKITATWRRSGTDDVMDDMVYGDSFSLQAWNGSKWTEAEPVNRLLFLLRGYILKPGENGEMAYDVGYYYGPLQAGRYRIAAHYFFNSERPIREPTHYVYAEFTVE